MNFLLGALAHRVNLANTWVFPLFSPFSVVNPNSRLKFPVFLPFMNGQLLLVFTFWAGLHWP